MCRRLNPAAIWWGSKSVITAVTSAVILASGQSTLIGDRSTIFAETSHAAPATRELGETGKQSPDKEKELRQALSDIRQAIHEYKSVCDQGLVTPLDRRRDDQCYPPTLETLTEGLRPAGKSYYILFLRRIPVDPMTGKPDWRLRSAQDEKEAETWGGQNVYDVYSHSDGYASDGTRYRDW